MLGLDDLRSSAESICFWFISIRDGGSRQAACGVDLKTWNQHSADLKTKAVAIMRIYQVENSMT
jgi:hypothetical protein